MHMEDFDRLVALVARLRGPGGCPWDREQDHRSIRKYVIEEAYEVAEAIDRGLPGELCGELGDLLLQVVLHAQMASELDTFDIAKVCQAISEKLIRRHPHVFGEAGSSDASQVARQWEAIKAQERGPGASVLDGVPRALPALQRADRVSEKASRLGLEWQRAEDVLAKVDEERAELGVAMRAAARERIADELGDLLFTIANLARKLNLEPEDVLHGAIDRFASRVRQLEATAREAGEDLAQLDAAEIDRRWEAAKRVVDPTGRDR
jgi:MazG family protein